jgi:hypothetical protein
MALIVKKHVTERETASYKLDRSTVELVRFYSEFIGSPQEHVVNESLLYIFRKDKDFNIWLKANDKPDLLAVTEAEEGSGKRRHRTSPAAPSIAAAASTHKS